MSILNRVIRNTVNAQSLLPLKQKVGKRLRETYYNAEVLLRIQDKVRPLNLDQHAGEPARINLIIPEIDFRSFYGGYIAKFNLARRLTEQGEKVRFVIVDPCEIQPGRWREEIREYQGLESIFDQVEVAYCFDRKTPLPVSADDSFIASTWWSAYIAHEAAQRCGRRRFVYLIQEYEPFTFPLGSYSAMAAASYEFPHAAVFSSPFLEEYFNNNKYGVFSLPEYEETRAASFENAILSFDAEQLRFDVPGGVRKLLFYARPEAHAARNMFEVAYLALARSIERGVFDGGEWLFHGIGSSHGDIPLPGGRKLEMLGKFGLREYGERLLDYDVGLSLMYTPHPSLLPLEMAAAGMLVVTNECMNKTRDKLAAISCNLIGSRPTIEGVGEGLREAVDEVANETRRRAGSEVKWASSWDAAFDDRKIALLRSWLHD
ncbi:MAG: hypothetical protein U9Q71_06595 [Pseudomonadota bacterium]|nr:hypothetical protein [Pseudomonadota bacterium]